MIKRLLGGYGDFGPRTAEYNAARSRFPSETIDFILNGLNAVHPLILDVGCGTGIGTRQLSERGAVVLGCDIDRSMVDVAIHHSADNCGYLHGAAEKIPMPSDVFDGVTCFSAFHWFDTSIALREFRRVIKQDGMIAIINKNESGTLKSEFKGLLTKFVREPLPNAKKTYEPQRTLELAGFYKIKTSSVPVSERYTVEAAMAYLQSVSLWNLVPGERRPEAKSALEKLCASLAKDGWVSRELNVVTVLALNRS
jgi:SAM-dependent methyltransferase